MARLLKNTWLYRQPKPKYKKKRKAISQLQKFANQLNKDLPKSEIWFHSLYKRRRQDRFNKPFGRYIPDVINKKDRYIIEVDGSIHTTPEQIIKDQQKTIYYKKFNYKVFRIVAYSQESFDLFMGELTTYLETGRNR